MLEIIFIVEEDPEGGYSASALGHAIFTQADTLEELKMNIKDALKCHFDGLSNAKQCLRHKNS
ncbi:MULTISPECIES: type II toxin-antitoxin system HicB family antitoxin [Thermodesulfovibrio]|jgi:predicted RNase H-like HicB family nuclease|uniref:type II toxin-antitoxin system HicB family antitoxin n=1 Tax=Thermodesulfovibrio TaxID=28261 RepID=UPI00262BF842|nr:hypothetical protein [Thermodesulfovibrio sp.]